MVSEHEGREMYTNGIPENVEDAYKFLFEGDAKTAAQYLKQHPEQVADFMKEAEESGAEALLHLTGLIFELVKE